MKKLVYSVALVLAFVSICFSAEEVKLKGECTLSFKGRIYSQGPCEAVVLDQKVTDIKGKVPENGVTYSAIIDEQKRTGALIGASTFVLADGALEATSAGATYVWGNGYALEVKINPGD